MARIATKEPLKPNFDANPAGDMLRGLKSAIYDISSVRGLGLTFASIFTAKLCLMRVYTHIQILGHCLTLICSNDMLQGFHMDKPVRISLFVPVIFCSRFVSHAYLSTSLLALKFKSALPLVLESQGCTPHAGLPACL